MGLGNLFTSGGPPGMSAENQKWLRKQQLRALFAQMASASAPSRDPRSGSLGYILGQGAQGMAGATGPAMSQIMASDKFNAMRDARKQKGIDRQALKDVPRNKMVRSIGPQTPQGAYPQAEGNVPRDMGAYLKDYAMTAMRQGDMDLASKTMGMSQAMQPKSSATKNLMFQDEKGNYRWGLIDNEGNVKKDLRAATDKETKAVSPVQINMNSLKPLSGETAGKLAMLNAATKDIKELDGMLFPEGKLDLFAQAGGFLNMPIGQGRQISSRIDNAVATKLRLETGAAATEGEVRNTARRFKPTPGVDDAAATRDKLKRLEEFMGEASTFIDPSGKYRELAKKEAKKTTESQGYDFEYIPGEGLR